MKVGFIVNDVATEEKGYTTTRLGMTAVNQGHEVWVMGVGDLLYNPDETIVAHARTVNGKNYKSNEVYLNELKGPKAKKGRIVIDNLDFRPSIPQIDTEPAVGRIGRHRLRPYGHAQWDDFFERPQWLSQSYK